VQVRLSSQGRYRRFLLSEEGGYEICDAPDALRRGNTEL
jgi:hypothetical protein